jgi:DNA invertase Pin-like site-specific DNA recombinase
MTRWREVIKIHPAADLLPLMSAEELRLLGGLAEFERDLIRARTGEGRARAENGPTVQTYLSPEARGDQAARRGRRNAAFHSSHLQRQRADDFTAHRMLDSIEPFC